MLSESEILYFAFTRLDLAFKSIREDPKTNVFSPELTYEAAYRLIKCGRGLVLYTLVRDHLQSELRRVKNKTLDQPSVLLFNFILNEYYNFSLTNVSIITSVRCINCLVIAKLKLFPLSPIPMFRKMILLDKNTQIRIADSLTSIYCDNKKGIKGDVKAILSLIKTFGKLEQLKTFYLSCRSHLLPELAIRMSYCIMFESD